MNEIERDRRLDAAWTAASREEPPPALDATIRAAARRAVGAAPGRARNKHWWYPLAAVATVAVLALGIVQLMPPEQVAPTIVAEVAVAPREARQDIERRSAAVDAASPAPPATMPAYAPQPAPGLAAGKFAAERPRAALAKERTTQAAQARGGGVLLQEKLAAAPEVAAANTEPSAPAPAAAAAAPRGEPFPASPKAESRRDAQVEEQLPATNAAAGAAAGAVQSRVASAKVAHVDEGKAKDAAPRSAEEWFKRIRALKSEGRVEEAAKELAAFRVAYGEHADALLPADLRPTKH